MDTMRARTVVHQPLGRGITGEVIYVDGGYDEMTLLRLVNSVPGTLQISLLLQRPISQLPLVLTDIRRAFAYCPLVQTRFCLWWKQDIPSFWPT